METLGEDLVLLALRPNGTMHAQQNLRFAVAGAELLRLAALGRVRIAAGRVLVLDGTGTGHPLLDDALADLARGGGEAAAAWIARARPGLRERYLACLAAQDVVRVERHRALGLFRVNRWHVLDLGRLREVRARLDRIAASTGELTPEQTAFAGLVHVAGLDLALYPSGAGAGSRARLRQIGRKRPAVPSAVPGAPLEPDQWLVTAVVAACLAAAAPASVSTSAAHSGAGTVPEQHNAHHHDGAHHDGGAPHGGGGGGQHDGGGGAGHHGA